MNSNDPCYADAFVVVGPHRTGTSLAAGVLHLLGVEFGSHLLPGNEFNRKGHWEHRDIVAVHQELLRCAGSTWHDFKPLPRDWMARSCVQPLRAQLARIVERDFAAKKLWGFKEPRTCCLLPVWLEILDELGS